MNRPEIGLTPIGLRLQKAGRRVRQLEIARSNASESQIVARGLDPRAHAFAMLLDDFTETEDGQSHAVDLVALRERWEHEEPPTVAELVNEMLCHDILQQEQDGQVYVTSLGRAAMNHLFPDY
jgi:hypothetical protein